MKNNNNAELEAIFVDILNKYSENKTLISEKFKIIETFYSEKKRYYHNLNHIFFMTQSVKPFVNELSDPDSYFFAVFYHDIIYNSKKHDNEENSAGEAEKALVEINFPKTKIDIVKELIIRTKNHSLEKNDDNADIKLILDTDLKILATDTNKYLEYSKLVRKEYSHVPMILFKKYRKDFLQKVLSSKNIYKHPYFIENFENKARYNIQQEIKLL